MRATRVRCARRILGFETPPHDGIHRQGWNHALESLEDELLNHYAKGQLVSREDVIRLIRLLLDYPDCSLPDDI